MLRPLTQSWWSGSQGFQLLIFPQNQYQYIKHVESTSTGSGSVSQPWKSLCLLHRNISKQSWCVCISLEATPPPPSTSLLTCFSEFGRRVKGWILLRISAVTFASGLLSTYHPNRLWPHTSFQHKLPNQQRGLLQCRRGGGEYWDRRRDGAEKDGITGSSRFTSWDMFGEEGAQVRFQCPPW